MMRRPVLSLACVILAWGAARGVQDDGAAATELGEVREQLLSLRDDADPALIAGLAERGDGPALDVLLEVYDRFASAFMRREAVRALAAFASDGGEPSQRALGRVAAVAIEDRHPALQAAALEVLAAADLGEPFLRAVVESNAPEPVRLRALRLGAERVETPDDEWLAWCERVFEQAIGRTGEEQDDAPRTSRAVANLAFQHVAARKSDGELREAVKQKRRAMNAPHLDGVRRIALVELYGRDPRAAAKIARQVFGDVDESGSTRLEAAKLMVLRQGPKAAGTLMDAADQATTPAHLRDGLADLVADLGDPAVEKKLLRSFGNGSVREKLFCIRALAQSRSEKVDESLVQLLADEDEDVGVAAATMLARRLATSVRPSVEEFVRSTPPNRVVVECIDTLAAFGPADETWTGELVALAAGADAEVGHAAVTALATGGPDELASRSDALVDALAADAWSTRLAALHALEKLGTRSAVAAIVERMQVEEGQMSIAFGETLWRLSGETHGSQASKWRRWWGDAAEGFERLTATELAELEAQRAERSLRQTSRTGRARGQLAEGPQYFGLVVSSRRVAFVLDVSGSMNEALEDLLDEEDEPQPRIEVAKRELVECIQRLEPEAQFNVITFSGGVHAWLSGGVAESDDVEREDATTFVSRLGAGGGTNLYSALEEAFADPQVNTVFVLSDGEPSVGVITDPATLRERVRLWNEHRGIVIHTIAVGGTFEILRWIAEDSGGTHVEYR